MELIALNINVEGDIVIWISIHPKYYGRVVNLCRKKLPDEFRRCNFYLKHKNIFILPALLEKEKIPFEITIQGPGECIINPPGALHMVVSTGL